MEVSKIKQREAAKGWANMTDKQPISDVSQHVRIRQPGQHAGREAKRDLTEILVFDCPGLTDMGNNEYFSRPVSVLINQPKAGLLKILLVCRLHLLSFPFSTILMRYCYTLL